MNNSFKGHTTVTDHYLEFYALILIMISMCMLKVKKNTSKWALQSKIIQSSRQCKKALQNRNKKTQNRGNTILQRHRDNCTFCSLIYSFPFSIHFSNARNCKIIHTLPSSEAYPKYYKSEKPQITRVKLADMQCFLSVLGSKCF